MLHRRFLTLLSFFLVSPAFAQTSEPSTPPLLTSLTDPRILKGDAHSAFRNPLIFKEEDNYYLFFSCIFEEEDHLLYWYLGFCKSKDLVHWSEPKMITNKNNRYYSSPGNVFKIGDTWHLTAQTYPQHKMRRGDKLRYGDPTSRVYLFKSKNLENWPDKPELLKVKGEMTEQELGKMIDLFILPDRDIPGKWWAFWKQDQYIHNSWSYDLKHWTMGAINIAYGENPQVFLDDNGDYLLVYAPSTGVAIKRSKNLLDWSKKDEQFTTLGQESWPWCETRLTAGYIADFRKEPGVGKYIMVFHSMGPGKKPTDANVNANCSIGIAWSDDLKTWGWPGKK